MKPRLLLLLNRLAIGGPASNTLPLATALQDQFEILLVAGNPLPDEQSAKHLLDQYKGLKTIILPEIKRSIHFIQDFLTYRKFLKIIRDFKPTIVHTHGSKPGFLGRLAAAKCKVPLIAHTYHGHVFTSYFSSFVSGLIIRLERMLANKTDLLIAINEHLQHQLIYEYQIADSSKVKLNRLGIDVSLFNDEEGIRRKTFRQEFQMTEDVMAIAIVGRLVKIKQHTLFLEIADQILQTKNQSKRYCFFIVGDGDEYAAIEARSKELGHRVLQKHQHADKEFDIVFTSWRKDMGSVMAGIDLLLMTSLNEGTPVAILEAMAAGKAIVSTPVGGIPELVASADCGFISSDKSELVKQIILLSNNDALRANKGRNGKQFVGTHLTVERQSSELAGLYFEGLQKT